MTRLHCFFELLFPLPVPAAEHNCYSSIIKEMLKIAKCKAVDKEKSFKTQQETQPGQPALTVIRSLILPTPLPFCVSFLSFTSNKVIGSLKGPFPVPTGICISWWLLCHCKDSLIEKNSLNFRSPLQSWGVEEFTNDSCQAGGVWVPPRRPDHLQKCPLLRCIPLSC